MAAVETKVIYRLDVSGQEFGLIVKALESNGKKGQALASTLKRYRDNFREQMIRQFEANIRQTETEAGDSDDDV